MEVQKGREYDLGDTNPRVFCPIDRKPTKDIVDYVSGRDPRVSYGLPLCHGSGRHRFGDAMTEERRNSGQLPSR